jgi:hypothetical protein
MEEIMAELLVYPQADLPPQMHCQVLTFLRVEWPDGFVGENRLRNWITRIEHHPLSFLMVEDGLVISHAQVVWKYLEHCGETYKIYGLTGVFTFPSFRGQGYGQRTISAATKYIANMDADVGMFHCSPHLEPFYAQASWIPIHGAVTLIGSRADPVQVDELMMMQFFTEKGRRGRESFERMPVFFDEDSTW